jgi:DNA-binding CsgD family transcriptional regulator/tetratricopeptide (TPR) repeat protein
VLGRLAPFLGAPAEPDTPDLHARSRMFEAVLGLLSRLSADTPVLLVLEDLQWADRSTLDFLLFLVRSLTHERLLVAASYRSSDLHPRHPLRSVLIEIDRARRGERFELQLFNRAELGELVTAILGSTPSAVQVACILELSDGNPFFTEELAAAGVLDRLMSAADIRQLKLPERLRDTLIARVELLSDEAQGVLRAAATAGRHVSHRLLATVCDMPERSLLSALRESVAQHLLVVTPGENAYAFRHALAREAVYDDLLPGERIRLHGAIAAALSADVSLAYSQSRSVATELAHHWWEAGDRPRALSALVAAGKDAADVCAFAESERQLARALTLWHQVQDPDELVGLARRDVLHRAADAARWAGHIDQAVAWTREALADAGCTGPAVLAAAYERLGHYLGQAGRSDAALEAYTEADRLLAAEPASPLLAAVRAACGTAHLQAGQYSLGLRLSTEAVEIARTVGAAAEEGRALNTSGVALTMTGRPAEGVRALRAAVEIAESCGNIEEQLRAYANLTFVLENAGQLTEALQAAVSGLERASRLGLPAEATVALLTVSAIIKLELGRWSEAEQTAVEVLERDTPARVALYFELLLAEIEIYRGHFDQAERRLTASRQTVQLLKEPQSTGAWHACLAELSIWRRRHEQARVAIAEGLRAVSEAEDAPQVLRLCACGLRAEADEAERLAAFRPAQLATIRAVGAELADRARQAAAPAGGAPVLPEVSVLEQQCLAEWSRLAGASDAEAWRAVRTGWQGLERIYPAAYAGLREAESVADGPDRGESFATPVLREAHRVAVDLGADPLRREIESLARRARIGLAETVAGDAPGPTDPMASPADRFQLTPREREVLRYVGLGYTNRTIARELFITEKTASVHVSNILAKLNVSNRGQAAAIAHRLGLIEPDAG